MKYYIIAGERSGDMHGGNLVKALRKHDPQAELKGIGGEYMQSAGVSLSVHYGKLAFMGFLEVVKNLNTISRYTKRCKQEILEFKPDVVILIDYGGFNMRIAAFAKEKNIKVFYYITPKVWAWYQKRALKLKRTVTRMFVILPFEKDFFRKFEWDVDYVGNPVLDAVNAHQPDQNFLSRYNLDKSKPLTALLPGSRKQELQRMLPLMIEVAQRYPEVDFAVAVVSNLDPSLYNSISSLENVKLVKEDTYNLLLNSKAAIVTSGTATLETGLFRVPQVVVYKASPSTYWFVKMIINVKFISLVNLIAGREIIREMIQEEATADKVGDELKRLIFNSNYRNEMLKNYDEMIAILNTGSASENTARLMVKYLKEEKA